MGQMYFPNEGNKSSKAGYWFFIILFAITTAIGFIMYFNADSDRDYYVWKYNDEHSKVSSLEGEKSAIIEKMNALKRDVANVVPFVITEVKIGNMYQGGDMETDYGNRIYSSKSMFLAPKIYYRAFTSTSCTLYTKLYNPYGYLSTGNSSPNGYSQSKTCTFSEGNGTIEYSGWGGATMGHWDSGDYKLEIWYKGKCMFVKNFKIYD